jgi:predicted transcriptional regulator of viral defense system
MRFNELLSMVGDLPCFEFSMLAQLSDEKRDSLRTRLYQWRKTGKLIALRRGMYAIAEPYRRTPIDPAQLSNRLYTPSYLSLHWALSVHGLIPEKTVAYTAICPRVPRTFENSVGTYIYRTIKQPAFFGYNAVEIGGHPILMASPEKALLDLWYIDGGTWPLERMQEMRFQNPGLVDKQRLAEYTERFQSPRLTKAAGTWQHLADQEKEGTVEL